MSYALLFAIAAALVALSLLVLLLRAQSAKTRLQMEADTLQRLRQEIEATRNQFMERYEQERELRNLNEREIGRLEQVIASMKEQQKDRETIQREYLEAAKASVMKTGAELSSKLLDDHKRETKLAKEESEKQVKQTTEELQEHFKHIFASVKNLSSQVQDMEVVRRALLNPSGAGNLSEITLENIFRASSLREGEDYRLQYVLMKPDGKQLKPDAVVFLPHDSAMILDAKASKFFLERAQAENDPELQRALDMQLKQSMYAHLKSLVVRDYKEAFSGQEGREKRTGHISMLMFLPTESAVETIRRLDPHFMEKAYKEHIIPVGPAGLVNALIQSKMLIASAQQQENLEHIVTEVRFMVKNIATLYGHSEGVGKNLFQAMKKYDEFAKSFNRTFISGVQRLDKLGINPPKKEVIQLQRYQYIRHDLEGEAEELMEEETKLLEAEEA